MEERPERLLRQRQKVSRGQETAGVRRESSASDNRAPDINCFRAGPPAGVRKLRRDNLKLPRSSTCGRLRFV